MSDDGTTAASAEVVRRFPAFGTWTQGPQRGLGPNRNHALGLATGTHVLFLDDDATLGETFLAACVKRLRASAASPSSKTIITGVEVRPDGKRIVAKEQDFLGFQDRSYRDSEPMSTVVINSALFPRELFASIRFDEQLVYGYDEVDLTTRAVRAGYTIVSADDAVNHHSPSRINRDYYAPRLAASRLYVTSKRRWITDGAPVRAAGYLAVAIPHLFLNALASRGDVALVDAGRAAVEAVAMLVRHGRRPRL